MRKKKDEREVKIMDDLCRLYGFQKDEYFHHERSFELLPENLGGFITGSYDDLKKIVKSKDSNLKLYFDFTILYNMLLECMVHEHTITPTTKICEKAEKIIMNPYFGFTASNRIGILENMGSIGTSHLADYMVSECVDLLLYTTIAVIQAWWYIDQLTIATDVAPTVFKDRDSFDFIRYLYTGLNYDYAINRILGHGAGNFCRVLNEHTDIVKIVEDIFPIAYYIKLLNGLNGYGETLQKFETGNKIKLISNNIMLLLRDIYTAAAVMQTIQTKREIRSYVLQFGNMKLSVAHPSIDDYYGIVLNNVTGDKMTDDPNECEKRYYREVGKPISSLLDTKDLETIAYYGAAQLYVYDKYHTHEDTKAYKILSGRDDMIDDMSQRIWLKCYNRNHKRKYYNTKRYEALLNKFKKEEEIE